MSPKALSLTVESFGHRRKQDIELMNRDAWLHGLYVRAAIGACFSKQGKYPKRPFDFQASDEGSEDDINLYEEFREKINVMNKKIEKIQGK